MFGSKFQISNTFESMKICGYFGGHYNILGGHFYTF